MTKPDPDFVVNLLHVDDVLRTLDMGQRECVNDYLVGVLAARLTTPEFTEVLDRAVLHATTPINEVPC